MVAGALLRLSWRARLMSRTCWAAGLDSTLYASAIHLNSQSALSRTLLSVCAKSAGLLQDASSQHAQSCSLLSISLCIQTLLRNTLWLCTVSSQSAVSAIHLKSTCSDQCIQYSKAFPGTIKVCNWNSHLQSSHFLPNLHTVRRMISFTSATIMLTHHASAVHSRSLSVLLCRF